MFLSKHRLNIASLRIGKHRIAEKSELPSPLIWRVLSESESVFDDLAPFWAYLIENYLLKTKLNAIQSKRALVVTMEIIMPSKHRKSKKMLMISESGLFLEHLLIWTCKQQI